MLRTAPEVPLEGRAEALLVAREAVAELVARAADDVLVARVAEACAPAAPATCELVLLTCVMVPVLPDLVAEELRDTEPVFLLRLELLVPIPSALAIVPLAFPPRRMPLGSPLMP